MDNVIKAMREYNEATEAYRQAAERVDAARVALGVEKQRLQDHMEALARHTTVS